MRSAQRIGDEVAAREGPDFYAAIARLLGLSAAVHTEVDLARQVERGIPPRAVEQLQAYLGLADEEVYRLIAPRRTLARRRAERTRLTSDESGHAVRVARVSVLARRVFAGRPDYAPAWLREPKRSLDGRAPLELIATEPGARAVEEMLLGIEHGLFA